MNNLNWNLDNNTTDEYSSLNLSGRPPRDSGFGLGWNVPTIQLALEGLGGIMSLLNSRSNNKLAKKSLKQNNEYAQTNLRNQAKNYNFQLESILGTRGAYHKASPESVQTDIAIHRV